MEAERYKRKGIVGKWDLYMRPASRKAEYDGGYYESDGFHSKMAMRPASRKAEYGGGYYESESFRSKMAMRPARWKAEHDGGYYGEKR